MLSTRWRNDDWKLQYFYGRKVTQAPLLTEYYAKVSSVSRVTSDIPSTESNFRKTPNANWAPLAVISAGITRGAFEPVARFPGKLSWESREKH